MTNLDEYLADILAAVASDVIYELRTGKKPPGDRPSELVIKENRDWLLSEYVKPPTDWTKVKSGTFIRVKGYKCPVRFVGFWNGEVFFVTKDGEWYSDHDNYNNLIPSEVSSCECGDCEEIEVE